MIPQWFPYQEIKNSGEYSDFHKIGEGGFGEVFIATRYKTANTSEKVIIKLLKPMFKNDSDNHYSRFLHESDVLKKLKHPQIPKHIASYDSKNICFYIMEYIPGIDLNHLLKNAKLNHKTLSYHFSFYIIDQILGILESIHPSKMEARYSGFIHGDLNLKNILITDELKIFFIDFSMSGYWPQEKEIKGGTHAYMPPEYFTSNKLTLQLDLYAIGVIFFELLNLKPLISKKNKFEIFTKLMTKRPFSKIQEQHLAPAIEKLLLKALAYSPEERFINAQEFRKELRKVAAQLEVNMENTSGILEELKSLKKI